MSDSSRSKHMKNNISNLEAQQYSDREVQERAIKILSNYQLLMKYAPNNNRASNRPSTISISLFSRVANSSQSIPEVREYFQKIAQGIHTPPIIRNWF